MDPLFSVRFALSIATIFANAPLVVLGQRVVTATSGAESKLDGFVEALTLCLVVGIAMGGTIPGRRMFGIGAGQIEASFFFSGTRSVGRDVSSMLKGVSVKSG